MQIALRLPLVYLAIGGTLTYLAGCDASPRAPALRNAPVYQNNREGFRFLVPDNWIQTASAALPSGTLEGEIVLVQYKMKTAQMGAAMEVLCFEESYQDDIAGYHQQPSHGRQNWRAIAPPESAEMKGADAQRFVYESAGDGQPMLKEAVVVQRNGRIYSFIGLFWKNDVKAREQLRRAVNSTVWKGIW